MGERILATHVIILGLICEFTTTINYFTIERIRNGEKGFIIEEDDYTDNILTIPISITDNKINSVA